jgi:hypothetical protein
LLDNPGPRLLRQLTRTLERNAPREQRDDDAAIVDGDGLVPRPPVAGEQAVRRVVLTVLGHRDRHAPRETSRGLHRSRTNAPPPHRGTISLLKEKRPVSRETYGPTGSGGPIQRSDIAESLEIDVLLAS